MSNENSTVKKSIIVEGTVTSAAMDKTIVVEYVYMAQHPLYKKPVKKRTRYRAHDEENKCKTGDKVKIQQTRPLSKTKGWMLVEIL